LRLSLTCIHHPNDIALMCKERVNVEFRDDGCYRFECKNSHKTKLILQNQKFEMLFDIGAHAILDGYYREAVSSFTSSLERFYEFALRTLLEKSSGSDKLFQEVWKNISAQSERQLGAYTILWASNFNQSPRILSSSDVKFRNAVIHKGMIPTKEEAINYGDSVLKVLVPQMLVLRNAFPIEVGNVVFYHQRDSNVDLPSDDLRRKCFHFFKTIICLANRNHLHDQRSMQEHLVRLEFWNMLNAD
jgi:hypothetical protein